LRIDAEREAHDENRKFLAVCPTSPSTFKDGSVGTLPSY
jgi:hypothetical protein